MEYFYHYTSNTAQNIPWSLTFKGMLGRILYKSSMCADKKIMQSQVAWGTWYLYVRVPRSAARIGISTTASAATSHTTRGDKISNCGTSWSAEASWYILLIHQEKHLAAWSVDKHMQKRASPRGTLSRGNHDCCIGDTARDMMSCLCKQPWSWPFIYFYSGHVLQLSTDEACLVLFVWR